ncbi:hypothetical protein STAS_03993 [Striga asiatica]|uniref:Uncharacterized protein n=1 Tax=Striga asiatica TaxID=4170 RepID=A0A5A7P5Y1_STRAF|nr:hypothetical protein STAS_03993 [Striga asiatica]
MAVRDWGWEGAEPARISHTLPTATIVEKFGKLTANLAHTNTGDHNPPSSSRPEAAAADESHRSPPPETDRTQTRACCEKPDPNKLPKQRSEPATMESQRLAGHPQPTAKTTRNSERGPIKTPIHHGRTELG